MWRFYAFLIELVSFIHSFWELLFAKNQIEWASKRTFFALETGAKLGAIEWVNKK